METGFRLPNGSQNRGLSRRPKMNPENMYRHAPH
jgi:hypothetical protein